MGGQARWRITVRMTSPYHYSDGTGNLQPSQRFVHSSVHSVPKTGQGSNGTGEAEVWYLGSTEQLK